MGGYMRQINPSVKVIAILASALIISFSPSVFWNAAIVVVCFASLLISGCMSRKVLNVLLPATLASLSIFMALLLRGSSGKEGGLRDKTPGSHRGIPQMQGRGT